MRPVNEDVEVQSEGNAKRISEQLKAAAQDPKGGKKSVVLPQKRMADIKNPEAA